MIIRLSPRSLTGQVALDPVLALLLFAPSNGFATPAEAAPRHQAGRATSAGSADCLPVSQWWVSGLMCS
jgi:hypothetical protein